MKFLFVLGVLVAAAAAAPPSTNDREAQILRSDINNIGVEGYSFGYDTTNGIKAQEEGHLKNVGTENEAMEVRGQYSYVGTDNIEYIITYLANEFGFQPSAPHLPVGPKATV